MKIFFNIFFALIFSVSAGYSQNVGINTTGNFPHASSMLDIASADKGLLIPRVSIADLNATSPIASPETSLLVYNTNTTTGIGYYFWDGAKWVKLMDTNADINAGWYKVSSTEVPTLITDSIFTNGTVGIGTELTTSQFQVVGLPVHADNTAATSAGLAVGAFYRSTTGQVMVRY